MTVGRIILKIEGPEANKRHVELPVFLEKIRNFHQMLNANIKSDERKSIALNVVQLSHSSPVTVECEPNWCKHEARNILK